MIAGQRTDAGAEKKKGTERAAVRNGIEERSESLMKVGTILKERRDNYGNLEKM